MEDDPGIDFSTEEWKNGPAVSLVIVLAMAALVSAGGLLVFLGPDVFFPIIQRYPNLMIPN
jgi:hypothetical protein